MFKVLDLFSGIGGFSLGLERTGGFKTIAFCEIDNYCQRVLHKHWPEVYIHSDIRTLTGKHFDGWERPDVIAGGFPCQDISIAGDGAGIDGERSGLWGEYVRLVGELRPRFVIVENSAALTFRGLGTVLGDLATRGYDAEWQCLPAAAFGAPHLRDRIWILAYPGCESGVDIRELSSGRDVVFPQGGNGDAAVGSKDRELVAMVPGVHSGVDADWWRAQSRMARSAHGIRSGMDRRRACGNSIVPQIATWIGQRILEASDLTPATGATCGTDEIAGARKGKDSNDSVGVKEK